MKNAKLHCPDGFANLWSTNNPTPGKFIGVALCIAQEKADVKHSLHLHNWKERRKYLKWVEKQLTVHSDFPAWSLICMRHPNKDDVVDAKHQHKHKGGLCQFPANDTHTIKCITCHRHFSFHSKLNESSNNCKVQLTIGKLDGWWPG